jgi:lysophospholipase L1-like esterase
MLGQAVEYGAERAKATCEASKAHCVFVDVREAQIPTTNWDHIHPTWDGYRALADKIWEVKNANNIPF